MDRIGLTGRLGHEPGDKLLIVNCDDFGSSHAANLAIMRAMPDMTVLSPGDIHELVAMMDWAQATLGPVYLRLTRGAVPDLFDAGYVFEPGSVRELRPGGEVALVSTGPQTSRVLAAADLLAEEGIQASVLHVPCLKPLDETALLSALAGHDLIVTVEEHSVHGGLGGLVAEVVTSAGAAPRIDRVGVQDTWGESAGDDFLLAKHGLSAESIADRVRGLLPIRH